MKIKEILPNEEFLHQGHIFILTTENDKVKFKHVRKHNGSVKKDKQASPPPSEQEIKKYALDNGYDPEFMWEKAKGYIDAGMKDSKNNDVKNLKLKLNQVWFKPEFKIKPKETQTKTQMIR